MDIAELNRLYSEAESVDKEVFAEQRSNILLVSGNHYSKKNSKTLNRIKDSKELSGDQKLRLTKNHLQKITKEYVNNILSAAPTVAILPKNENELQDQKAAELHNAVLQDLKQKHKIRQKTRDWCADFVNVGEVAVKVFYDYSAGKFQGYFAEMDEATGQPKSDPSTGQMVPSENASFSGDLVFERVYGFNLLRAPEAKTVDESPYLIVRKMIDTDVLRGMLADDEDKKALITPEKAGTYVVFDGSDWERAEKQTMLREYYYRSGPKYPNGYYFITVSTGILWEGELPFGIFPVKYKGFDEFEGTARARSIIKQLRPYQVEINRAASKMAEHQITLGDDKILIQKGTSLTQGGQVPGVRALQYTGLAPTILPGRAGDQYLTYMNSQISEMYRVASIPEIDDDKDTQVEPYTQLFRTIRQKKRYSLYSEKFEEFLIEVHETALELKRAYCSPEEIIAAIGSNEAINIAEFKNATPLCYQIKVEAESEDVESKLGKLLSINHILQYASPNMGKDDIGKLVSLYPYVNKQQIFEDMTLDYKNATNDILALDRGEAPKTSPDDNHEYMLKKLTNRMKQSSFKSLRPEIQMAYERKREEHRFSLDEQMKKQKAMESELIPTGGYFVVCDYYVTDPKDPAKKQRVKVPSDALEDLINKLEGQGMLKEKLFEQNGNVIGQVSDAFLGGQGPISGMPPNMPMRGPGVMQ